MRFAISPREYLDWICGLHFPRRSYTILFAGVTHSNASRTRVSRLRSPVTSSSPRDAAIFAHRATRAAVGPRPERLRSTSTEEDRDLTHVSHLPYPPNPPISPSNIRGVS